MTVARVSSQNKKELVSFMKKGKSRHLFLLWRSGDFSPANSKL
jgi:hypothetical protein